MGMATSIMTNDLCRWDEWKLFVIMELAISVIIRIIVIQNFGGSIGEPTSDQTKLKKKIYQNNRNQGLSYQGHSQLSSIAHFNPIDSLIWVKTVQCLGVHCEYCSL